VAETETKVWTEANLLRFLREAQPGRIGDWGEHLWKRVFENAGLNYIPLHKIQTGSAPVLEGPGRNVLPDFQVSSTTFTLYADSKAKSHPVYFRKGREWRHGINRSSRCHYDAVAGKNRLHCCIAIFEAFQDEEDELYSGSLLIQTLNRLGPGIAGFSTDSHKVFWPRDAFHVLGILSPTDVLAVCGWRDNPPSFKDSLRDFLEASSEPAVQKWLF
jgi:hypothetical protein